MKPIRPEDLRRAAGWLDETKDSIMGHPTPEPAGSAFYHHEGNEMKYEEAQAREVLRLREENERLRAENANLLNRNVHLSRRNSRLRKAVNWLRGANHDESETTDHADPIDTCPNWECQRARDILAEDRGEDGA